MAEIHYPLRVDKTPDGQIVETAGLFEEGYGENIEYKLQLSFEDDHIFVNYYGEDGQYLSEEEIDQASRLSI